MEEDQETQSPFYANRITVAQYKRESKKTTEEFLQSLANDIRRDASLALKTYYFQDIQRPHKRAEAYWRLIWSVALLAVILLFHLAMPVHTTLADVLSRLIVYAPSVLCGAQNSSSFISYFFDGHLPFLSLALGTFLCWVFSMHFEARRIELQLSKYQLAFWPLFDFFGRVFALVGLTSMLAYGLTNAFGSVDSCKAEAKPLLNAIAKNFVLEDLWKGSASFVTQLASIFFNVRKDEAAVSFFALAAHILALKELWMLIARASRFDIPNTTPALFFLGLATFVVGGEARQAGSFRHAQLLIIALVSARVLRQLLLYFETFHKVAPHKSAHEVSSLHDIFENADEDGDDDEGGALVPFVEEDEDEEAEEIEEEAREVDKGKEEAGSDDDDDDDDNDEHDDDNNKDNNDDARDGNEGENSQREPVGGDEQAASEPASAENDGA